MSSSPPGPRRPAGPRSPARRLAILLAALSLAACYTWQPAHEPLGEVVAEHHSSRIRIVLADETAVEVTSPAIVGDSLYARRRGEMPVARAVVSDVTSVEVRGIKFGQTVAAVLTTTLVGFGAALMIAW